MRAFSRIAFTPNVKAAQERLGSRGAYARLERGADAPDTLGDDEVAFLAERDSFYMASVGESGWPYIQHRGGPKGFVRVLDERTLAFADRRGNRQYVSVGNVAGDERVALIFMDYPHRARLKLLARAKLVTRAEDPETFERVAGDAPAERVFLLYVQALDWNCPQHITPSFTEDEVRETARPLLEKLEALERENRELRARLEGGRREWVGHSGLEPEANGLRVRCSTN
jgi:predicted pyridoxine 5'-phosphate oxidase superfamily flavin-nucleotide-binding protein